MASPTFGRLAVALAAVLAVAAPFLLDGQPYLLHVLTLTMSYAVPAIGLNLLLGYTGLVSLGHMGFAGVGAYVTALLMMDHGWPAVPAMAAGAAAAGGLGVLVGIPCLRLRSHFFIIVTLAVGMILFALFNNLDGITGGAEGLPGVPRPQPLDLGFAVIDFRRLGGIYWFSLAVTAVALLVQYAVVRSDFGRSLAAIRQDETLAAARGVNVFAHKLAIFAISTALAGLGGGLKVMFLRVAAPLSFELLESINLVLMTIVGGAGYLAGPVIGALVYVAVPEILRFADAWRLVLFGAVLVAMTLFAPRGISGLVEAGWHRLRRTGADDTAEGGAGHGRAA